MIPRLPPGRRTLVYGIGNRGRQDDGLAVVLIGRLEAEGVPEGVTLEANYQLTPEDALTLADHDVVLFVDATAAPDATRPYGVEPVAPAREVSFSTHALTMGALLALCQRLYGRAPQAYALALPATAFEVNAELSAPAREALERALVDLRTAWGEPASRG